MPRYKLILEYDGTWFHGFQKQKTTPQTVQAALETALGQLTQETPIIHCAGRTDTGVHATHQVVHIDLHKTWQPHALRDGLNFYLDHVAVLEVCEKDFHARFDAISKTYIYRLCHRRAPPVLEHHRCWHIKYPLDIEAMRAGACKLIGHHDFQAFRSSACSSQQTMRTLDAVTIDEDRDMLMLSFKSRSFLHNQVRIMTGTLVEIGLHKKEVSTIDLAFTSKQREHAGQTAPPYGLCLADVRYIRESWIKKPLRPLFA